MLDYTFTCRLPNGVHARPASAIEEVARPFAAAIAITNERTGQVANAKSVLGIVSIDVRFGDRCLVAISGADERPAFDAVTAFLETDFPHSDDLLPPVQTGATAVLVPPVLAQAGAQIFTGAALVSGIGEGRAVVFRGVEIPDTIARTGASDIRAETARLDEGLDALIRAFDARLEHAAGVEAAVLKAHRSVARDPEFRRRLEGAVRERGATAAGAIADAEAHFTRMLFSTGSALLRERALDIRDVCGQLLHGVYGDAVGTTAVRLAADSVCIADTLTPSQFLALDRRYLKGLVLAHGGTTSHTVVLARSFAIPTLAGVTRIDAAHLEGRTVIVDGGLGVLVAGITDAARRYYDLERRRLEGRRARMRRFIEASALTADGQRIEVAANIGTAEEAAPAFGAGAEGIGLFRTEMLFVDRPAPPSEEEQFDQYRRVLADAGGRPVIIRTLDVGGDKPIPYLHLPEEDNPFLGYRAVRLYPEFDQMFRAQVAALVRASAFGRLKVMVPMVSQAEEVRWIRAVIADEQSRCARAGIAFDATMQVGAMVEVPSLAFLLDQACRDLDFFSIGTNDLLQYFVAVDRANHRVAALYNPLHPAFLRLLKKIVDDAHAHQRWVGLCGEMGGQLQCLPLLVGLGLDEISMAAPAVAPAKAALASLSSTSCAALLGQALACSTAAEVEQLVARFESACPAPLIEPGLIVLDADGRTKEEAIKQIVDRLYIAGRTDHPMTIEEAVWRREAMYSTGFGYGFAIPHCKTDEVRTNSLAVLKLQTPVQWDSLDGKPVSVLLLLAIRESDSASEHMKVLAALARKVMHEDFRDRLLREQSPDALVQFLRDAVGA